MRRCVIVGASPEIYWDGRWVPDIVICADGGYGNALRLGLVPELVIGDFDSSAAPNNIEYVRLPVEKDLTDMEACVDHALTLGMEEIALLGATGGRIDHFLGNIGLLERAEGRAFLLDAKHEIRIINGSIEVHPPHIYPTFSLISLDESASGVYIRNAKYPLVNADLRRSATVGISNSPLCGEPFSVSVEKGKVLLILSGKQIE